MSAVFLKLLNMSIAAGWLVVAVIVLRLCLKKAPKAIHCALWALVAIRLLCPFSLESSFSLIPEEVANGSVVSEWTDDYIDDIDIHHPSSVYYDAAIGAGREPISDGEGGYYVVTKHDQLGEPATIENTVVPVLSWVWIAGVVALLLYAAISCLRIRSRVKVSLNWRDNIWRSEQVDSPFILGVIRPKIYLPFGMNEAQMSHVVAHEQAHLSRRDHWWKPLGFILLAVYWFNPLMWVAYSLLCRDIELACDEKVIRDMGAQDKKAYSEALLACSVPRRMIAACPLAFGEVGVKKRIASVLHYKKPAFWVIAVSLIACAVVAGCLLTNPSDDNHAPKPFSHTYRVKTIMYQDTRYSFGYTMDTAPQYQLTSDYQLFVSGDAFDGSGAGEWVQHHGEFEKIKLSGLRFDDYFKDPGNLSGWDGARYGAESIREQTKQAWRLEVDGIENGVFYYLILTHTDKVLLCYGYNVGDTYAAAAEDSLIRWVFELERTDLLTCNAISEGLDAFVELACFPDTDIDRDTGNWPVAQINESGVLRFSLEDDANTLVVSEDYYRKSEDSTFIERNTFEIARNDEGFFTIGISRRESLEDHVNYFIKIKGQSDVYAMKIVFDASSIDVEPKPAQLGGSQTLSLNDVIMLSQKGYDLTWYDFDQYRYTETGSGLYIRVYEINEMFQLWVGGTGPDDTPMYIHLSLADDLDTRIDIRDGGVTEFIGKDHSATLLNKAIYDAILDCNVSEKTVGLNNCASFIMLDKEEISGTPVAGSTDHVGMVTVYGLALYQGYDLVDDKLYEEAGSHTPVAITFDVLNGKYSLKEYWRPGDGTYYEPDIREKFPDQIEDEAMNTQKYIAAQKQECYVQAMRHNGIEVSDPNQQPLSAEELSWFNETFQPFVYDKRGDPIGVNPWSCFFTSYYDDVRDLDFVEFMRYFPGDGSFVSDEEFAALIELETFPFYGEVSTRADMPVPISRYPARLVNQVLKEYAGITTAALDTSGLEYLPEYDAFYNYTSDFGPGMFTCTRGEVDGDIVRLYEELETGTDMLTLRKAGSNYQIVAHQCIEGNNGAEAFYG